MAYSNVLLKGRVGYNTVGWPLVIMERAKSDAPMTPVLCEVFGIEHECGSVYAKDISLPHNDLLGNSMKQWKERVSNQGFNPNDLYFKGALL